METLSLSLFPFLQGLWMHFWLYCIYSTWYLVSRWSYALKLSSVMLACQASSTCFLLRSSGGGAAELESLVLVDYVPDATQRNESGSWMTTDSLIDEWLTHGLTHAPFCRLFEWSIQKNPEEESRRMNPPHHPVKIQTLHDGSEREGWGLSTSEREEDAWRHDSYFNSTVINNLHV